MIRIDVDERSGFCTGVVKAVKKAEDHLATGSRLYSLGELVHNPEEVERLRDAGLEPVSYEEFDSLEGCTVLIRAHGEPPETFSKAEDQNIRLIDATCNIVKKLQDKIRDSHADLRETGGTILIFGKSTHPEVRALVGQTGAEAIVVRDPGELSTARLNPPVHLFSQTTMNRGEYRAFQESLAKEMVSLGIDPAKNLHIHDTICRQVSSREKYLREFVPRYELVFFVSGRESSNGKALFEICRKINENTHFISTPGESDTVSLEGVETIGICGATSTPGWLMQKVKTRLLERMKRTGT
jgi:4-hydroxy-3-methylbut-2-enyl diphosphate reductase